MLLDETDMEFVHNNLLAKEVREHELWLKECEAENETRKKAGKKIKEINKDEYEKMKQNKEGQKRWIVCLNPKVAKEEEAKRDHFKKIIDNKIASRSAKEWITKNGYRKYKGGNYRILGITESL